MTFVLAIDGPSGSGKSSVSRRLAAVLEAVHLDTGAIYRGLAFCARLQGIQWRDRTSVVSLCHNLPLSFSQPDGRFAVLLDGEDIESSLRSPEIALGAALVSRYPEVREHFLGIQRAFETGDTLVAEGRDIGTVVFPWASLKIFLTGSERARARRRLAEDRSRERKQTLATVLSDQKRRDISDQARAVAPLRASPEAKIIDTSRLTIDQVVKIVLQIYYFARNGDIQSRKSSLRRGVQVREVFSGEQGS